MFDFDAKVRQSFFVELGVDENRTLSQEVYDQLVHGKNSSSEVTCHLMRVSVHCVFTITGIKNS